MASNSYLREVWQRRDFAVYLAYGRIKARNASTYLGIVWWVLNPLILALIFLFVFGVIFDASSRNPHYLAFLLSGIFPFYYTRAAMLGSAGTVISNARLLANVRFPRLILVVSSLLESAIGFLASLVVFFILVGMVDGILAGVSLGLLIPAFVLHTALNLGLGALTARLVVPFRDVHNLVPYLLRLWLYLSPIAYSVDEIPDALREVASVNPMVPILGLYRSSLMGSALDPSMLLWATLWAIGVGYLGVSTFVRAEAAMVRHL